MQAAKSFNDILALRGRIVIFTPNAAIGLKFEQHAERHHAQVVCTRGHADPYIPLGQWSRIHAAREYGVLSCDQRRWVTGVRMPATDLVWVGPMGDPFVETNLWACFSQAMGRVEFGEECRRWTIAGDAL